VKRPEGFDRLPEPPAAPSRRRPVRERAPRATAEKTREKTAEKAPAATRAETGRPRRAPAVAAVPDETPRFTRARRARRRGWLLGGAIAATVLALLAVALFSPVFALRHVRVEGAQRLDPAQLEQAVSGQLGTPLALLDDGRIARELGAFPLIRSWTSEVVPPDTLVLRIAERSPVAVVAAGDVFRLVDPAGVEIEQSTTRPDGLPLIDVPADEVPGAGFTAAAEVLLALPADLLPSVDVVTATTRDDVAFTLRGTDQRVVWGSAEDSAAKARVLSALIAVHGGSGPGEYDVSASGSVVFRELG